MESQPPLRIVIASRIFSPEPSAASFMLEAIAIGFRDAGHKVTVLTTTPPSGTAPADIPGIVVKRAPVLRDRQGYVRGYLPYLSFDIPLFFRLLFTKRADLYFVEPPPTTGAVVRVATWLLRRPYVYDAADLWSDAARLVTSSTVIITLLRSVELFALRGARHAFAISAGLISRMRELNVHVPTTAIGFGADSDSFHFLHRSQPATAPYFIYAGSYSEWHGADIFVDAFARFSADHPGYRLLFLGNGSDKQLLEKKRSEWGLDTIEFREPVGAAELNRLLADATASLASLKPGQGYDYAFTTKAYSSIAAGCPIIFTGVGPTVAFITSAAATHAIGTAVSYDVDAVVAAMTKIADNPVPAVDRSQLSDWARERYSLQSIADVVVRSCVDLAQHQL